MFFKYDLTPEDFQNEVFSESIMSFNVPFRTFSIRKRKGIYEKENNFFRFLNQSEGYFAERLEIEFIYLGLWTWRLDEYHICG